MSDPLYELLTPYFSTPVPPRPLPHPRDRVTSKYLSRLTTLPLSALTTDEPTSLTQSTHSANLALQSLSARSTNAVVASSTHLSSLRSTLPLLASAASSLRHDIPDLDAKAAAFSDRYSRAREDNELLDRRKRALLLARNADRLGDILDLPTLLESAIASSSSSSSSAATNSGSNTGFSSTAASSSSSYASALDLHSHIKRLHLLYPDSPLVTSIYAQTESAMQEMTTNLILSLRSQNIKLAAGMRTIGWLRRVAPELDGSSLAAGGIGSNGNNEGSLGALFLVCRLGTLMGMISALAPLRDLADQETEIRLRNSRRGSGAAGGESRAGGGGKSTGNIGPGTGAGARDAVWAGGQQTERYLKRFIEIFREQSFAIVSMYRSIFPNAADTTTASSSALSGQEDLAAKLKSMGLKPPAAIQHKPTTNPNSNDTDTANGSNYTTKTQEEEDPLLPLPSALSTFPLHLITLLTSTLRSYLPNVRDKTSRESLLTQVLYCAGSLGRLGGDFGLLLADLGGLDDDDGDGGDGEGEGGMGSGSDEREEEEEEEEEREEAEWVAVMQKHRVLAGKLEKMAANAGGTATAGGGGKEGRGV